MINVFIKEGDFVPATVTHAYFSMDVYDVLPEEITNKLDKALLKMFAQSTDPLMFYNLFNFKKGKDIRNFQKIFHKNNTQKYFINLLHILKENPELQTKETYSFLVGMICHYILDSTLHPYIIYKTGNFQKEKKESYKYNNVHTFMETFLDNDMIKRREKKNPYSFPISKFCFQIKPFSEELNTCIRSSFYETFKISHMDKIYYQSLKQMKMSIRLFRQDSTGLKKIIYKTVDTFTPRSCFRFEAISYHYPLKDYHQFLNNEHHLWRNPTSFSIQSTESFLDLYLKSIKLAKSTIVNSFSYLKGADIDLKIVFPNKSYITGLDCNLENELKYFEF